MYTEHFKNAYFFYMAYFCRARDDSHEITRGMLKCNTKHTTVEPLTNDHPHQRPSLLYDHISCDGQCFLSVRSLTNDHPSNATNDRVGWDFLPLERPLRVHKFPRITGGTSTFVPNCVLLHCCAQIP